MQGSELAPLCLVGYVTWGKTHVHAPSSQDAIVVDMTEVTIFCPVGLVTSSPAPSSRKRLRAAWL